MPIVQGYPREVSVAVVPGGPAATLLGPAPGLQTTDQLISVHHVSGDGSLVTNTDVTSDASIVDYETIRMALTVTTGDFLIVVHHEVY